MMLLLLDNFEQVTAAAPQVGELLRDCRQLKLRAEALSQAWENFRNTNPGHIVFYNSASDSSLVIKALCLTVTSLNPVDSNLRLLVQSALDQSGGLLRLAPCWVPRSFLQPAGLKLHPDDLYAYGLDRGGIDERWFASTTPAANENRTPDEGLSYCVFEGKRFTLAKAIEACGAEIVGESIWNKYRRWPVYSKFFDNMGPIPHHMHQSREHARLVGQEGKPESYYFRRSTTRQATISRIRSWASNLERQRWK